MGRSKRVITIGMGSSPILSTFTGRMYQVILR